MNNNLNIINKEDKSINLSINYENESIQIIINTKKKNIDLLLLSSGEIFKINNTEYLVLEQLVNKQTKVVRKEPLKNAMMFDSNSNNWKTSSIREF